MLLSSKKGSVLIMVSWISMILIALALSIAYSLRLELRRQSVSVQDMKVLYTTMSGVKTVISEIYQDTNTYTSLNQKWKKNSKNYENLNINDCNLLIEVEDEESKLNINIASDEMIRQLFSSLNLLNSNIMIDSILDWRNTDSNTRMLGAEESYSRLEKQIHCKNENLDSIDEISLIRGFKDQNSVNKIIKFITVYSSGKININTASKEVLMSLPNIDSRLADAILTYRLSIEHIFKIEDDLRVIVGDKIFDNISNLITVKSNFFKVRCSVKIGKITKVTEVVLKKIGRASKIKYWRELT